jgi:hypothetical protein
MGKFNKDCCPTDDKANTSGTLTGGNFTVPANAKSVTLMIHSSGGVDVLGEITGRYTFAGTSRNWDAKNKTFANAFNFTANANTIWEVNYII